MGMLTRLNKKGLGGTSLINANVFMEADDQTLAMNMWPPEIRDDVEGFHKCECISFSFLRSNPWDNTCLPWVYVA